MTEPPPWRVELFFDRRGKCPVADFVLSLGQPADQAKVVRKLEHLAQMRLVDARRPLVDTLEGAVKELRVDKQLRVLFSWEREDGLILGLEATRKKNGDVDERVVRKAITNRDAWLDNGRSVELEKIKEKLGAS